MDRRVREAEDERVDGERNKGDQGRTRGERLFTLSLHCSIMKGVKENIYMEAIFIPPVNPWE
jgi:hypothetical protein